MNTAISIGHMIGHSGPDPPDPRPRLEKVDGGWQPCSDYQTGGELQFHDFRERSGFLQVMKKSIYIYIVYIYIYLLLVH